MRRCAELQGVEEESEFLLGLFLANAKQVEHPALHFLIVNTNTATTDFRAIQDQVICLGPGFAGIRVEQRDVFVQRCCERMVHGNMATFLTIPFKQREVCDPDELVIFRVCQAKPLPEMAAQAPK